MGRPLNKKNFGTGKNKLAVKFYDGSSVVTGMIVKQVGSKTFKVAKADGSGAKICSLAQDAAQLALLTSGTADGTIDRLTLCTIEVNIFGGAGNPKNVKSLTMAKLVTIDGTTVSYKLATAATVAGQGDIASVANLTVAVGTVIPNQTGTVAAAFSYQIPANAFTGGNLPLTYSIAAQAGFSIDPATGILTKAAGASTLGAKNIVVTATDADGDAATAAAFTVTLS